MCRQAFRVLLGLVVLCGSAALAADRVLLQNTVLEQPSALLAGVEYRVLYDEASGVVTLRIKGSTSAAGCTVIYQAIGVVDDANKAVNGYVGYCGHQPGPNDTLMTTVPDAPGWYQFTLNASEYGQTLGLFYGVVIRRDQGPCFETWFGLSSMTTPNDWANFDWSWDNRLKVTLPRVALDGLVYGEASRTIVDLQALTAPANVIASGYVKFQARVTPATAGLYYEWSVSAGSLVAPAAGVGLSAVKWDAPDGHEQAVTLTLTVRETAGRPVVCRGTANLRTIRPYVVRVKFVDDYWNEEQQIAPLPENEPEYDAIARINHPVCYVMHRGTQVEVDLAGAELDDGRNHLAVATPLRVSTQMVLGDRTYDFRDDVTEQPTVTVEVRDWSARDYRRIILESIQNLPTRVALYAQLIHRWRFEVMKSDGTWIRTHVGGPTYCQETTHGESVKVVALPMAFRCGLFITFDTTAVTAAEVTAPHLAYACLVADAQHTVRGICGAVHARLSKRFFFGSSSENPWAVVDTANKYGNAWDCITLSRGMASLVKLLGIEDAANVEVYPSSDRNCLDQERVPPCGLPGHEGEDFLVWARGWNAFESTCRVDGWYYLGGVEYVERSPLKVLRAWLGNESAPPGEDKNGIFQCYTGHRIKPPTPFDYCRIVPCP